MKKRGKKMKVLKVTEEEKHEQIDELFDEVKRMDLEKISPEVFDGETNVRLNGHTIADYNAAFFEIPSENPVFGRVLLEMVEEKGVTVNYPSTGFYIMAKKNYLYYVLHQKDIDAPNTVIVSSEKAARNIDKELDYPMMARRYEDMALNETKKIVDEDEVKEFVEGTDYGEDILIFQEMHKGDKYRCMYVNDSVISLKDTSEGWRIREDSLQYSNLSKDLREEVKKTMKAIGTKYGEVLLQGGKIIDVKPNPDPELYTDVSGKNAYESIAAILKENG